MLDWENRSCLQKMALIISVITIIIILICLISNIVITERAASETWFVKCSDCKGRGGDTECGERCCTKCSRTQEFLFYTLRAFSMLFCLLGIAAEFPQLKFFRKLMAVFNYFWGRGIVQILIGFLTLTGNLSPDDEDAANVVAALGWIAVGCGFAHFLFSCLCFKEYNQVADERRAANAVQPGANEPQFGSATGSSQSGMPPPARGASGHTPETGYAV
jgi:hypothetical protein